MSVVQLRPQRERKPGPYEAKRRCSTCRCYLSQNNPSDLCAPCQGGDWHSEDELTNLQAKRLATGRLEDRFAA